MIPCPQRSRLMGDEALKCGCGFSFASISKGEPIGQSPNVPHERPAKTFIKPAILALSAPLALIGAVIGIPLVLYSIIYAFTSFHAGTWDDDPGNWERAFGTAVPNDFKIIHSRYTRSPHFTLECQYFFEYKPSAQVLKKMSDSDHTGFELLKKGEPLPREAVEDQPPWFAPKQWSNYDIYQQNSYFLFIDWNDGIVFFTDRIGM